MYAVGGSSLGSIINFLITVITTLLYRDYYCTITYLQLLPAGVHGVHGAAAQRHVVAAGSRESGDALEETLALESAASSGTAIHRTALNVS